MIPVTRSFLPPIQELTAQIQRCFDNGWLTNRGELVLELEATLKKHLGVDHLTLTTNGTLPLQIAIKALKVKGEVITTPFSYVATTSSIVWEGCTPIFVDIDPLYWTIDENKIEAAITQNTTAILATHVFGNPCNVIEIERIAKKHNLKVIYDGAHAFGVNYHGKSIFNYGDVSTCSFHATKLFHTGEGGCWIVKSDSLNDTMFHHHNFGHNGSENFHGLGINAKMSELQAAMGLAVFPYLKNILKNRKHAVLFYQDNLKDLPIKQICIRPETDWNYAYFPVVFDNEERLIQIQKEMNNNNIFPRRYFFPSLNDLPYVRKQDVPVATSLSKRILCLPLWHGITDDDLKKITNIIKNGI